MAQRIRDIDDFRKWVKVQCILNGTSQAAVAVKMDVKAERISEAIHGKKKGKHVITPLIKELGGNLDDFKAVIPQK